MQVVALFHILYLLLVHDLGGGGGGGGLGSLFSEDDLLLKRLPNSNRPYLQ